MEKLLLAFSYCLCLAPIPTVLCVILPRTYLDDSGDPSKLFLAVLSLSDENTRCYIKAGEDVTSGCGRRLRPWRVFCLCFRSLGTVTFHRPARHSLANCRFWSAATSMKCEETKKIEKITQVEDISSISNASPHWQWVTYLLIPVSCLVFSLFFSPKSIFKFPSKNVEPFHQLFYL